MHASIDGSLIEFGSGSLSIAMYDRPMQSREYPSCALNVSKHANAGSGRYVTQPTALAAPCAGITQIQNHMICQKV